MIKGVHVPIDIDVFRGKWRFMYTCMHNNQSTLSTELKIRMAATQE